MSALSIQIYDEEFILTAERFVFWPRHKTLICSDLHLGKMQTFRKHGIAIPGGVVGQDLERLGGAISKFQCEQLFIVGDLLHSCDGFTKQLQETVAQWRSRFAALECVLIEGNHDRPIPKLPECWNMTLIEDSLRMDHFNFSHEPKTVEGFFTWAGHLHPTFVMKSGHDRLRLPCFYISEHLGILPAFSKFTNGLKMKKKGPRDRIFVSTGRTVIEF